MVESDVIDVDTAPASPSTSVSRNAVTQKPTTVVAQTSLNSSSHTDNTPINTPLPVSESVSVSMAPSNMQSTPNITSLTSTITTSSGQKSSDSSVMATAVTTERWNAGQTASSQRQALQSAAQQMTSSVDSAKDREHSCSQPVVSNSLCSVRNGDHTTIPNNGATETKKWIPYQSDSPSTTVLSDDVPVAASQRCIDRGTSPITIIEVKPSVSRCDKATTGNDAPQRNSATTNGQQSVVR